MNKKFNWRQKALSVLLAAAVVFSSVVSSGITAYAESTEEVEVRYANNIGSTAVTNLTVPTLAYDDTSITLVWNKPENYANVANYNVYCNGSLIGDSRSNFAEHADWANTYMDSFYKYYENKNIDMVQVDIHTFRAEGLTPETEYKFSVEAVDNNGAKIGDAANITWSTTASPEIFNIVDFGAEPVNEGYVSLDAEKEAFIVRNTKAIQTAIDTCTDGGKVVIPAGIFMSGSIYLKSNMTLELQDGAVLFGSPNVAHYDQNYLLYPYSTDTRSWGLINCYSPDENGMYENIRIVGNGTIYGNGWKYGEKDTINGDGYSPYYQKPLNGDPDWTKDSSLEQYKLKRWVAGNNSKVKTYGILAKNAAENAAAAGLTANQAYATRPNLVVLRGVDSVYIEGITVENPAFHTIAVLDSKNVVSENVKYITYDANNADGIELGNTQNALIFNNFFDTGDDSINFATGMGKGVQDSGQVPSSNIWIFNNFIRQGHGGVIAAGSHTGAGIENILAEDNVLNHAEMPFRFKSAPANGGGVSNVLIRDTAVGHPKQVFTFSTSYSDANQAVSVEPADKPAEFYNIDAYNITADTISKNTFEISASVDYEKTHQPWHNHHNLYFQDITFTNIAKGLASSSEKLVGVSNATFHNVVMNWTGIQKQENDAEATTYKAWGVLNTSTDLKFTGTTTQSTSSYNAMAKPNWTDTTLTITDVATQDSERNVKLEWNAAQDGEQPVGSGAIKGYIIETYIDEVLVDKTTPVNATEYVVTGLSPNVNYEFYVYAVDAPGNKVLGPQETYTTTVGTDEEIAALSDGSLSFSGIGYTWGTAKFNSAKKQDARVRGYRAYVNNDLVSTIYNYQIDSPEKAELSLTIGRMMTDNNEVYLEAFTDSGKTYKYDTTNVATTQNYDFHAPVWSDDNLNLTEENGDIVLTWNEPEDPAGIYAYRVYVDSNPVYTTDGDYFNHVNGTYTTKEKTYTISGLDLSTSHTFRVEAADNWWKALDGSGPFHWTNSGPTAEWNTQTTDGQQWKSTAFGQSTDLNFSSNVLPGKEGTNYTWPIGSNQPLTLDGQNVQDVVMESRGGKLQAGHDGITFYYTEIPTNKNFCLTADITVEQLGPENGDAPNKQEGAGLMVRDVNGAARKDPLEEGYEEYPAASNMVMLQVGANAKSKSSKLDLIASARYGVNDPAGNLDTVKISNTFQKSVSIADAKYAPTNAVTTDNYYGTATKLRLERTDDGFTTSYLDANGQVINSYTFTDKNVTPNIVSHLDDKTMYVGFFVARNSRMTVKNIDLQLTDVITPDESTAYVAENKEQAQLYVASSEYTNRATYTVQALTNADGKITVYKAGKAVASNKNVIAGTQFISSIPVTANETEIKLVFTPSEGIDKGKEISKTINVKKQKYSNDLYVSSNGSNTATGTQDDPMSVSAAVSKLMPGGTIYMLDGIYDSIEIPMSASGNYKARKSLIAEGDVIVRKLGSNEKIFVLDSDYWNISGLDIDGQNIEGTRGVRVHGSYNEFRNSKIHHTSSDAGFVITKSRDSRILWPSYNLVDNCESYENRDISAINADGFASKSGSGDDNKFTNCVSHDNADDGWDLYNTLAQGPNGRTIIENCVAYNNGNNGFKLGGEGREVAHVLRNSVAYNNNLDGITDNFNPGSLVIENNTSFDNNRFNYILRPSPYKTDANGNLTADGIIKNNVSYRTSEHSATLAKVYDDKIYASVIENNFFYENSVNSIDDSNFVSLNTSDCYHIADKQIFFGNFLRPVSGSVIDLAKAGAVLPTE